MAPTKHSTFAASSSARLLACPGSFQLSADVDDGQRHSTVFSAEGTLAHSISEVCITTGKNASDFLGLTMRADGFEFTVDEDFAEAVQVYVDTVRGLQAMGYVIVLERRVSPQVHWDGLPPLDIDLFGTADCVAYRPDTQHLMVVDLKFGRGVPVNVQGNTQLLYYGAGVAHPDSLAPFCAQAGLVFSGVKDVDLVIVQPRAFHRDGPVRRASYTYAEVRDWSRTVLYSGVERAMADNGKTLRAGDHCRWCPALPHCTKPRDTAFQAARQAFMNTPIANIPAPTDPGAALPDKQLSDQALGDLLDKIEIITPWLKAVKELALERAKAQRTIPGHKLVPKRKRRMWADDPDVIMETLEHEGLPPDKFARLSVLSPAQVQKNLGKKLYDQHVAPHVVKQSSGLTLASEGDPRERIKRRSGRDAFASGQTTQPMTKT